MPTRSSDVVEEFSGKAIGGVIGGIILLALSAIFFVYNGNGSMIGLASVLCLGGLGLLGWGVFNVMEARKVVTYPVVCPYCKGKNSLTEKPNKDFTCRDCHRLIPVDANGEPMAVHQVRCGFCNTLNYYSDKSEVLLCEDCNREIPIAIEEGRSTKHIPKGFARVDDDNLYELVLVSHSGHHTEELIGALQHILALNRNQVKQILEEMPITLLTGIPKMKAEMLQAQLSNHGAVTDYRVVSQ